MLEIDATAIVIGISFLVFMVIMNAIFYAPMLKLQDDREEYVENNYQQAKNYENEAKGLLSEHDENIRQTRKTARDAMTKTVDEAKASKSNQIAHANSKAVEKIKDFHNEMAVAKTQIKDSLSNDVLTIAQEISTKILGEEVPLSVNMDKR